MTLGGKSRRLASYSSALPSPPGAKDGFVARTVVYRIVVNGSGLDEREVAVEQEEVARHRAVRTAAAEAALGHEVAVYRLGPGSPSTSALIYFAPRAAGQSERDRRRRQASD